MPTSLICSAGADFSLNASGFAAPVPAGLLAWFFIGALASDTPAQAQARSLLNLAYSGNGASMVGTIPFAIGYGSFTPVVNYMQSDISETNDFTIVAVYQATGTLAVSNAAPIAGTLVGSGSLFYYSGTTGLPEGSLAAADTFAAQSPAGSIAVPNATTNFKFLYHRVNSTAPLSDLGNKTDGQVSSAVPSGARQISAARKWQIGSGVAPGYPGPGRLKLWAYWNRYISDAEMTTVYNFAKNYELKKFGGII
jgi:hypothetical protein